ncbi:MAG: hypothetical protein HY238_04230 [Acidobacteria bacterium]|nr:hypothetical protein [Acidobacteriota bacterium]
MPSIKLTDQFGLDLEVQPNPSSGIAKYFQNLAQLRFSDINFSALQNISLQDLPVKDFQAGLSFQQPVAIAGGSLAWTISAGAKAGVSFSPEQGRLSVKLAASVSAGAAGGFQAGAAISLANSKPFAPSSPFASALRQTLEQFTIPAGVEDLDAMAAGAVVTVEGNGTLKFSGQADLATAVNPLAGLSLPAVPGIPKISAGGSLQVGASFQASGGYQLRLEKLENGRVKLGCHKKHGSEWQVQVQAQAGLSNDLLNRLVGAISGDPRADEDALRQAGLGQGQIASIQSAIQAGVERKLAVSVAFELGSLQSTEAAFLYEIDLAALYADGREAVQAALHGDFSGLAAGPGIQEVESLMTRLRQRSHRLRVNLLGIYNFQSVSQLALEGKVFHDEVTGDLVITDKATASRIDFGAAGKKLRHVLAEQFLITAAYRASPLAARAPALHSSHAYFELHAATDHQTMKDNLDVAQALGLLSEEEKQENLAGVDHFGNTTFYAETGYEEDLTVRLFLDDGGQPRSEAEYERVGREALQLLVQKGDPDDFRRRPALDDALWANMKSLGQANFRSLFPETQLGAVIADYTVIVWWAEAMRKTAEKLAQLLASPDDSSLRRQLAKHLESVAGNTKEEFGDPWGLVAMDVVSGRRAAARVEFTGPILALARERT